MKNFKSQTGRPDLTNQWRRHLPFTLHSKETFLSPSLATTSFSSVSKTGGEDLDLVDLGFSVDNKTNVSEGASGMKDYDFYKFNNK